MCQKHIFNSAYSGTCFIWSSKQCVSQSWGWMLVCEVSWRELYRDAFMSASIPVLVDPSPQHFQILSLSHPHSSHPHAATIPSPSPATVNITIVTCAVLLLHCLCFLFSMATVHTHCYAYVWETALYRNWQSASHLVSCGCSNILQHRTLFRDYTF